MPNSKYFTFILLLFYFYFTFILLLFYSCSLGSLCFGTSGVSSSLGFHCCGTSGVSSSLGFHCFGTSGVSSSLGFHCFGTSGTVVSLEVVRPPIPGALVIYMHRCSGGRPAPKHKGKCRSTLPNWQVPAHTSKMTKANMLFRKSSARVGGTQNQKVNFASGG